MGSPKKVTYFTYDGEDIDKLAHRIVQQFLDQKGGFGCPSIPEKGCNCNSCARARGAAKSALRYLEEHPEKY